MDRADAIILGGGPAGAAAAVWLARRGLRPLLIERAARLGGLHRRGSHTAPWLVSAVGASAAETAARIAASVAAAGVDAATGVEDPGLRRAGAGFEARFAGPEGERRAAAPFLILATGARPRDGGLRVGGRVVIGPGHEVEAVDFAGRRVAVLGGGDAALEARALAVARGAASAVVRARTLRACPALVAATPAEHLAVGPYAADAAACTVDGEAFDLLLVMYGWEPVVPLDLPLARRPSGHVRTDFRARASAPGVYAVGDVAGRMHPCVAAAIADGVTAAKDVEARLADRQRRSEVAKGLAGRALVAEAALADAVMAKAAMGQAAMGRASGVAAIGGAAMGGEPLVAAA